MEFHEKLQQLRKQSGLTQEQLAERLYVSRTAVSKWESGRGYPNLESLKGISRLFAVSIDELLSNDELLELAETENRANIGRVSALVFGVLDAITFSFLFLPFFGQRVGEHIRSVSLLAEAELSAPLRGLYFAVLLGMTALGGIEITAEGWGREEGREVRKGGSLGLHGAAILLFALSRQPYVTAFLFLLFAVKVVLILQENKITR